MAQHSPVAQNNPLLLQLFKKVFLKTRDFPMALFVFEVRWALANESKIKGSIDKALKDEFPSEYASRRFSHWKRDYFAQDWENVPDEVLAKHGQLPNKYRKLAGAPLKGRQEGFDFPPQVEEQLERPVLEYCH